MKSIIVLLFLSIPLWPGAQPVKLRTDVLVVGGTTGGTAAGIQSARSGAKTIILEQTSWLGGMLTAAGVSCTDGNAALPSGMWGEFRQALYKHYGTTNLQTGWVSETCFEPHVGDSIFKAWAAKEKNLQVYYGWYFDKALKTGNEVTGAIFINTKGERLEVEAKITVDGTDLGDVFASTGAAYDLGTEDSLQSREKIAPGKSNVIQDLTWAATLKDFGKRTDKTIPPPPGYDATRYYCSTSDAPCNGTPYAMNTLKVLDYGKLRVSKGSAAKYMLNWPAHGNDYYLDVVEMKPIDREKEYVNAKNQALGFIYFLQTTLKQKNIGLADDEMNKGLAFMPYNREGRRVRGLVRLNIDHIQHPYDYNLYRTGIAVGDYPVDHHHAQYPGKPPPIPFPKIPSFNIPLGVLIPERVEGLIVCEKGISVSNIANGTTRLQPVVLLTGQAAGLLAAVSTREGRDGFGGVRKLQLELLKNKCYLMPFVDVPVTDPAWEMVQRIGLTGILQGTGKPEGWANKTFFYPDSLITLKELNAGIKSSRLLNAFQPVENGVYVTYADIVSNYKMQDFSPRNNIYANSRRLEGIEKNLAAYGLPRKKDTDPLTRREVAVYLEYFFDVFRESDISFKGQVDIKM
jgi:hypothetical protein